MRVLIPITGLILSTAAPGAFGAACNGSTYPPCFNPTLSDINYNTAGGNAALASVTNSAVVNTAFGYNALLALTIGSSNTAVGAFALFTSDGSYNTAVGSSALATATTAGSQTAVGYGALKDSTTGEGNTAIGAYGMERNTTGSNNVALGRGALRANESGNANIALGNQALLFSTGTANIALGSGAGKNLSTGSNNVYVGNAGLASESGVIRIGAGVHTRTFIAGINNAAVSGATVVVGSNGQLGIGPPSSARFKKDIQPMGASDDRLMRLRPVTFKYKADPSATPQYGLIAEEVEQVYPELVVRDADRKPLTVQYQALIPLLLKQNQQQEVRIEQQQQQIEQQRAQMTQMSARLAQLESSPAPSKR